MSKKFLYFYILLFVGLFVFGGFFIGSKNKSESNISLIPTPTTSRISSDRISAKVIYVVDGDTLKVSINNKEDTVRLIGIDSPEILDERKPVQCFGKEASSKAREILNGKMIILESDSSQGDRDEYGRLLRYVFLDNLNFNKFMISEGFAREYTFKGKAYRYQTEFVQTQTEAQKNNQGLWNSC